MQEEDRLVITRESSDSFGDYKATYNGSTYHIQHVNDRWVAYNSNSKVVVRKRYRHDVFAALAFIHKADITYTGGSNIPVWNEKQEGECECPQN